MIEFPISIQYGQVVVYDPATPGLGLLWSEEEVAQGFAWDPKMVCFGVPDHDGTCVLRAEVVERFATIDASADWVIKVPFEVTQPKIAIGTILIDEPFEIEPGQYDVFFQASARQSAFRFDLKFLRSRTKEFSILKVGGGISTTKVLRTRATRA